MTATISTPIGSRLDTALGRFTMYRLVLWVLAVLAGYSLLLNVLGWLTFGLPEMLAHLALCLGLTYASNRAIAALFRVRPHSESSLITGLLLYFLFWPTQFSAGLQYLDLAGVALACVLASASKYALAWRGRHIFNPAAAGAFITGLTGLNIATWWAATPAMLWLVLPGVLLVLYRVRKLLMGAVFTLVAVSIVAVELLRSGMSLGEALWQPIAQRPVLFFVGFMLTEPLTLPPRRWQQLALAAVVGLLFAVPYNLGLRGQLPRAGAAGGERARVPRRPARPRPAPLPRLPAADADDDGVQLPARAPAALHPGAVHRAEPAAREGRPQRPAAGVQPDQPAGLGRAHHRRGNGGTAVHGQAGPPGPGGRRRADGHHRGRRLRPAAESRKRRCC